MLLSGVNQMFAVTRQFKSNNGAIKYPHELLAAFANKKIANEFASKLGRLYENSPYTIQVKGH